ncbi:hypothetical protein LCGC14_1981540 [marine sediment metagenome]|uniref:SprT-like domain-containing protein n=1 Tax=marine sediment metagenome TaxID=412755 RepID=A0A0F9F917_9ZZZZ
MLKNIRSKIKRRSRMTGIALYDIAIATILVSAILSTIVLSILIHRVTNLDNLLTSTEQLSARVEYMDLLRQKVYKEVITEAMEFAPKGKSIYQLRGDAQTKAQNVLDRLTKHYRVPRYVIPAIQFKGILQKPGDAGSTPGCEEPIRYIFLNEILYLRNYEEYIHMIIPHEVAHVFVCLRGGYEEDSHGIEWWSVMRDLGFQNPLNEIRHEMDTEPVYDYQHILGNLLPPHYSPGKPTIIM